MKKSSMFEKYPDVVEVDDLRKMLGGISRRLAYTLYASVPTCQDGDSGSSV